jgi:hypothetical protein
MKQPSRTRALRRVGLSSAIAITVLASGIGVASASTHASKPAHSSTFRNAKDATTNAPPPMPAGGPGGIGGDVTALTSSSVTIESFNGTATTYAINASTTVTDLREIATASSLALGDNVHMVVSSSDSSVATSIDIVPAIVAGRVSAINADTITVSGPQGFTGTIEVSGTTTYSKDGASAMFSDVSVGSFIFAEGKFGSSPTTIDAATIGIGTPELGNGPGPIGVGPFPEVPLGTRAQIGPHLRGVATK